MMSYFSPVAPPSYLKMLKEADLLGNYHLILAHDVVDKPDLYKSIYSDDDFIIMDNSLIELGQPVSADVMKQACEIIKPDCIVLPDHLGDMQKTLESTKLAAIEWMRAGIHKLAKNGFMVVPQGQDIHEMVQCINEFKTLSAEEHIPINYWSIPKIFGETNGSRMPALLYMESVIKDPCIHLLGFSNSLADDVYCANHPLVMGIDSAVPTRMGIRGETMHVTNKEHSARGNYFEECEDEKIIVPLVRSNLNYIRKKIV